MVNKKFLRTLVVLLIGVGVGFLFQPTNFKSVFSPSIGPRIEAIANASPTPMASPCFWSSGENSSTQSAQPAFSEKMVFNDPAAVDIIHFNCLVVFGATRADLEHNGTKNLVFWVSEAGCMSCHGQTVYVLSNNKVIFKLGADDPMVEITKDIDGKDALTITEPLRKILEGLAGPSWGIKTEYAWSDSSHSFFSLNQSPYNYAQHKTY